MTRKKPHDEELYGGAFFSDLIKNIKGRFSGIRSDYPPSVRNLLATVGGQKITGITIYRSPVQSFIKTVLNTLSFGKFGEYIKQKGFDTLFHLYAKIEYGSNAIRIEKNQVISMSTWKPSDVSDHSFPVNIGGLNTTINQFLDNGKSAMGVDAFFKYDAFKNNCQSWIMGLMKANNLVSGNQGLEAFVYQDLQELASELPFTHKVANATTNLASKLDTLIKGKGLSLSGYMVSRPHGLGF